MAKKLNAVSRLVLAVSVFLAASCVAGQVVTSSSDLTSNTTASSSQTTPTPPPMGPAKPSPTQPGLAPKCDSFHLVKSGDTCGSLVATYGNFTIQQFYSWNPAVGNTCALLYLDYWVCIGVPGLPTTTTSTTVPPSNPTPSPTQPGIIATCKTYYLVVAGDYCLLIADKFKITLSDFYKWNPSVGNTCQTLYKDYYVCVGVV